MMDIFCWYRDHDNELNPIGPWMAGTLRAFSAIGETVDKYSYAMPAAIVEDAATHMLKVFPLDCVCLGATPPEAAA